MEWNEFQFHIRYLSTEDEKIVRQAFDLGLKAHTGQMRQSGEPYFSHPIAVSHILTHMHADRDTIVAALLHDTVEDTPLTLKEIQSMFSPTVTMLVDGVTKLNEQDLEGHPSLDERIETLRKMFVLMQKDVRIMAIKLADRLHNMQTLSFRAPDRQMSVAKETMDIYVKIADRLCMSDMRDELAGLCDAILEPEAFVILQELRKKNETMARESLDAMRVQMRDIFPSLAINAFPEHKTWEKMRMQYELEGAEPSGRSGLDMAFVCEDVDACYRMMGALHQLWPREAMTFDDFINAPGINGYKGIHTTLILENGVRIRCKIRTKEMQEYAHKGITLLCFDSRSRGLLEYLPWTKHISPLSKDTEQRSEQFWQTLQNDILGESIIIYGGGRSALVPQGSTALDGALYLEPEKALYITAIRVNGKEVNFSQLLEHASSLELIMAEEKMVQRDWLYWAHTGVGLARIRTALMESNMNMAEIGKALLQKTMTEQGRGYVEEFDQRRILKGVSSLGYNTPEEAYAAIAQGHLEPEEALRAVFAKSFSQVEGGKNERQRCTIRFGIDRSTDTIRKLLSVYEKYNVQLKDVRALPVRGGQLRLKVTISLSPEEQEAYRRAIIAAGASKVTISVRTHYELLLMSVVVFLWALNPVIAKFFLGHGITPFSFVALRSIMFCALSVLFFLGWKILRKVPFSPIPNAFRLAILPAAGTFILSILTYFSISYVPPSVHLTVLRFNIVILPLIHLFQKRKLQNKRWITTVALFVASTVLITSMKSVSVFGMTYALLALMAYIFYSLVTEQTLNDNKIGIRYPYFLLHIGLILGLLGAALLPLQMSEIDQWFPMIGPVFLYVLFCVFIPHTCFHIVLQKVRFRHVTSMSMIEVPLAIAFEFVLLGISVSLPLYLVMGAIMFAMLAYLRWIRIEERVY